MKRTALILLMAVYLLSLVGIGINRFYCCGKLASVTLIYGAADNSSKESGKKDNCCKNEKQSFKVKDSHFNVVSLALDHPAPAVIPNFISLGSEKNVMCLTAQTVYRGNAPPGNSVVPIYTLNCTYRI